MHIDDIRCLGPVVRKELERQIAERQKQQGQKENCRKKPQSDFDSKAEEDFYYSDVWPKIQKKEIVNCELHKTFLLLPKSEYCGIKLHKGEYTPDFILTYRNGMIEVIEVKSKTIRKLQRDYIYRRRLFIDKYARPNGWEFREIMVK